MRERASSTFNNRKGASIEAFEGQKQICLSDGKGIQGEREEGGQAFRYVCQKAPQGEKILSQYLYLCIIRAIQIFYLTELRMGLFPVLQLMSLESN